MLPEPLQQVGVEHFIAPSMLTLGPICVLRQQGREVDGSRIVGLIESPWAVVGTLVHQAIQVADGRSNITEVFEELVRQREIELLEDSRRRHFVPLRGTIGEGGWSSRLALLATRRGDQESLPMKRLSARQVVATHYASSNHEVWLDSEVLGLRGSVDLLELVGDHTVRITDWKTGPILDANGQVKETYRLQLTAYRMLATERWPERKVETFLFNGETVNVEVTSGDEDAVRHAVVEIKRVIDGRSESQAIDLALLGNECADCLIRLRCPAYMDELCRTGRGTAAGESPRTGDVFGSVSSVHTRGETSIVNLSLPSGATAQIRLGNERVDSLNLKGQRVVAFGLIPFARRNRVNGEVLDPLMYEESNQSQRAWQAEIFRL